jgi:hypothetical protein
MKLLRCLLVACSRLSILVVALLVFSPLPASAVPSFARQTGLPCNACHTNFPELTAFGRQFKLNGYVMSSGDKWTPPIAAMAQLGFTHTNKGQPGGAAPGFSDNDNVAINQISLFYGGAIIPNVMGAFIQATYDGAEKHIALDNTDIRAAKTTFIGGKSLTVGVTFNNNPTVSDLWNTTPAWGFPYTSSGLAPGPDAGTLIQGAFAQEVAGAGIYTMFDDTLYVEVDGYDTSSTGVQKFFGIDPSGEPQIRTFAPYWRLALQHTWGSHYLSVGTFGMSAAVFPGRDRSMGTDHITDIGLDSQYQYSGDKNDASLLLSWISESQHLNASSALGNADNTHDKLHSFNATATYLRDKTYGLEASYFSITGTGDPTLYGTRTGSPDSNGYILEADWLPFNKNGGPSFYPMSSLKLSLQYVGYTKFDGAKQNYDGSGRNASDNDTLFLQAWLAF